MLLMYNTGLRLVIFYRRAKDMIMDIITTKGHGSGGGNMNKGMGGQGGGGGTTVSDTE